MAVVPRETHDQWSGWVRSNVASPFRKRALKAALGALAAGATPDQAAIAAKQAEDKRANYMATSALVLGVVSAVIALLVGGLAILSILFTFASAAQGRHSRTQSWQAWTGLALALAAVPIFVVAHLLVH
ncbi:MAG TPA: hypothetical protein VJT78_06865 [Candidatus Dormibacteraeota bacterium]|nr:hypothetical protein [Candidatus Dormibacteraeota bacterium]